MAITNYEEMSITSPAFNTVREAFDVALQRLLKKMEKSKMDEGQIALNITVTNEDVFTDGDAELGDTDGPEKKPVLNDHRAHKGHRRRQGRYRHGPCLGQRPWPLCAGLYADQPDLYVRQPARRRSPADHHEPRAADRAGERRADRHPHFQAGRRRRRRITPIGQLLGIKRAAHPQTSNGLRMNGAGQPLLYHLSGGNASAAVSERSAFRIPADGNGK